MYTIDSFGVGQTPTEAAPSLWENFGNIISKGVSAGFNIYNRVQNIQQQKQQTSLANQQAQQMAAMYQYGVMPPGVQTGIAPGNMARYQTGGSMFDGWTIPLLVMGVATVGFVLLKRK